MRWRRWWRGARRCTWAERRLLAEACLFLLLARLAVRLLPFRRTVRLFGLRPVTPPAGAPRRLPQPWPAPAGAAGQAGWAAPAAATAWAVRAAARTPGGGNCLAQALAGSAILRRRGIGSTLHLGVAVTAQPGDSMTAHAWLCCGGAVLTGAGAGGFIPVAALASSGHAVTRARTPSGFR